LVGHAFGSQGYTCLPTNTGGTAWNPTARPKATLFASFFGQPVQIITHFQSINENPKPDVTVPRSGNVTWQSSLDSSRVWAQVLHKNAISPSPDIASCPNAGSIACLLLQSIGSLQGPTGGNILSKTTFIQRLNTNGGSAPEDGCATASDVGSQTLVPYTADYYFFRKDQ